MPMRTGCLDSVDNVGDQIVRFPLLNVASSVLLDKPFASSEMGDSMDADLLPELSDETWVAAALLEGLTADLPPAGSDIDLITASRQDATLTTVRECVQSGVVPTWSDCSGLSPELRCWRLQIGNLSVDTEGRLWRRRAPPSGGSQLVVPGRERQDMIRRFHDSLFFGHLGVSRTVYRLQNRVYWPGLRHDVRSYLASCPVCLARKSPCPRRAPMGHVNVGHRWDRVAMDLLDMSVTTAKGNRYVLVMVDCFSRWTEACPLPDKTALGVADAFFQQIVCRFGMPAVIHSDQGREFENKVMQELCLPCGAHKTQTTPYHPESDGLVERFNRTLLMMLAMFAGENRDDWDDLLPAVMMAYRSSVHESTGLSPHRLMFGEECTLPMDVGLPRQEPDLPNPIISPYAVWVRDALEVVYDQVRRHSGQAVQRQKRLVIALLLSCKEVQTGFPLGWSVSCCVLGRLGTRDSATSGFTHYPCTLSRLEENSTACGVGVMDRCCSSEGRSHDSGVGRQYNGPHFTGFPLCGGFGRC